MSAPNPNSKDSNSKDRDQDNQKTPSGHDPLGSPRRMRALLLGVAIATVLLLGYLLMGGGQGSGGPLQLEPVNGQDGQTSSAPTRSVGQAAVGGPFQLVNTEGVLVDESDFAGKPMMIYFGFTYCPDVCPNALLRMTQALEILGEDGKDVQPIFISVDPERDTPERMKQYTEFFSDRLVGLTGTQEQVDRTIETYKVYAAKREMPESAAGYLMDHSDVIYLMDGNNQYLTFFTTEESPEAIAKRTRRFLN